MYNFRTKIPKSVLTSFRNFLDSKLYRLSLQQLEFEMDSAGYPDMYNCFELGYCGHPQYPWSNIFLDQASDLILSYFKEEDHLFISDALRDENIQLFCYIKLTNLRPTHPEQKIRMRMKTLINMVLNMEVNPLVCIVI